jgi:hypothetical protein
MTRSSLDQPQTLIIFTSNTQLLFHLIALIRGKYLSNESFTLAASLQLLEEASLLLLLIPQQEKKERIVYSSSFLDSKSQISLPGTSPPETFIDLSSMEFID